MEITNTRILKNLLNIKNIKIFINENLKNYLTFKPENSFCKCLIICNTKKSLLQTLSILKDKHMINCKQVTKHCILGNGSNVLFKNSFYNGYVVKLGKEFKKIDIKKSCNNEVYISVGAGVNLFNLNYFLKTHNLGGLEWSYGIPGTIGGAIIMNAGAFNNEISNFVKKVKIIENGKFKWVTNFNFFYRNSSFKQNKDIIVEVILKVYKSDNASIEKLQKEYFNKRLLTQPHNYPSAGSVFKRIKKNKEFIYPAKLIDNLGLKGVIIGGAEISEKHAGFIINKKNASAKDFIQLSKFIKNKIKENYNLNLVQEVKIIT